MKLKKKKKQKEKQKKRKNKLKKKNKKAKTRWGKNAQHFAFLDGQKTWSCGQSKTLV